MRISAIGMGLDAAIDGVVAGSLIGSSPVDS
jgi:hypothetical protein